MGIVPLPLLFAFLRGGFSETIGSMPENLSIFSLAQSLAPSKGADVLFFLPVDTGESRPSGRILTPPSGLSALRLGTCTAGDPPGASGGMPGEGVAESVTCAYRVATFGPRGGGAWCPELRLDRGLMSASESDSSLLKPRLGWEWRLGGADLPGFRCTDENCSWGEG